MHAADVMTPDVICAAPDTPLPELVSLMLGHRISALPIMDDGDIVGIVTEGDLLRRAEIGTEPHPSRWLELLTPTDRLATDYARTHGRKASEVMSRDVITVVDTAPLAEVAHLLEARRDQARAGAARRQAGWHRQPSQPAAGAGLSFVGAGGHDRRQDDT